MLLSLMQQNCLNFVRSPQILNILAMSKKYKQRPSDILNIRKEYAAYCFDEACIFLLDALEDGKELKFDNGDKPKNTINQCPIFMQVWG